jgi:hypothetical protein
MYSIAVKIEGIESRRRSAGVMHVLTGFYLIVKSADYLHELRTGNRWPVYPFLVVAVLSLTYGFFRKQVDRNNTYNFGIRVLQVLTFLILGFTMIHFGRTLDAAILFLWVPLGLLLAFSERRVFKETVIFLDEPGILIPGYYRDHLVPWQDLSQVIIREDFLTIFHSEKKYLQYQVMQDLSTLEVAKMNAFCQSKINNAVPSDPS